MFRSTNTIENRRIFVENSRTSYALYDAVLDGDFFTVKFLLTSKEVNPNHILKEYDAAPLHTASGIEGEDLAARIVECLLKHGANPNIVNSDGITPLMISCIWNRSLVSELLIKFGADPHLEDEEGKRAFEYALEHGHYYLYTLLNHIHSSLLVCYSSDNTINNSGSQGNCTFILTQDDKSNKSSSQNGLKYLYSDIDSDTNCFEVCAFDTGFRDLSFVSDSSVDTFFSAISEEQIAVQDIPVNDEEERIENWSGDTELLTKSSTSHFSISSCGTESLKLELKQYNVKHGPITKTTKRVYQILLKKVAKGKKVNLLKEDEYSKFPELMRSTLKDYNKEIIVKWSNLVDLMADNFANEKRLWRGGKEKQFFTYLLLDPFITNNLPGKRGKMSEIDLWRAFILSIFYIGKGKNSRPFSHLHEALKCKFKKTITKKILRIQEIWDNSAGVICLNIFHNIISAEAHTREAAMIDAIGLQNLTNIQSGEYYGIVKNWSIKQKQQLGNALLRKALKIYLAEGERQIFSTDLKSVA